MLDGPDANRGGEMRLACAGPTNEDGVVSLDSICHLEAPRKGAVRAAIEARLRRGELVAANIEGAGKVEHWLEPQANVERYDALRKAGETRHAS